MLRLKGGNQEYPRNMVVRMPQNIFLQDTSIIALVRSISDQKVLHLHV